VIPLVTPPPPAFIVVAGVSHKLARSSYCWQTTCADYIPARCGDGRTPSIRVRQGVVVRFRLGFSAKEVLVTVGDPQRQRPIRLATRPPIRWKVTRGGVALLFARARAGGDASYAACLKLR
jgi:hypothetical protein